MSSIPPSGPPASRPQYSQARPNRPSRLSDDEAERRAEESRRDSGARLEDLNRQKADIQREGESEIDHLKESYETEAVAEGSREETSLENLKTRGYENIRQAQQAQAAELSRVRRQGEGELDRLKEYYRNSIYRTDSRGHGDLDEMQKKQSLAQGYEMRTSTDQLEALRRDHSQQMKILMENDDAQTASLMEAARRHYEQAEAGTMGANQQADERFHQRFDAAQAAHQKTLNRLDRDTSQELREIRHDTAQKLAAYRDRQDDPFYRMMEIGAELSEESDRFVLTARIPSHEQEHVSVSVRGDSVVLSGYRRNEEKLELEPGHKQGTSAYQSYSESFLLGYPVDARNLTREFDGDRMRVVLPKAHSASAGPRPSQVKQVTRAAVDRPHFPANLPHTGEDPPPLSRGADSDKTLG